MYACDVEPNGIFYAPVWRHTDKLACRTLTKSLGGYREVCCSTAAVGSDLRQGTCSWGGGGGIRAKRDSHLWRLRCAVDERHLHHLNKRPLHLHSLLCARLDVRNRLKTTTPQKKNPQRVKSENR